MTMKQRIALSLVVFALVFGGGLYGSFYIHKNPVNGMTTTQRSERLGKGAGAILTIILAGIWLPHAAKMGRERRAARDQKYGRR